MVSLSFVLVFYFFTMTTVLFRSVATFTVRHHQTRQFLALTRDPFVGRAVHRPLVARSISALEASRSGSDDNRKKVKTSYDVDTADQEAEQHLSDKPPPQPSAEQKQPGGTSIMDTAINGEKVAEGAGAMLLDRYQDVLDEVGLGEGQLKFVGELPAKRQVSPYDIFCNRELRLSGVRAIGFDMDYTLAQYKQPAFDKLAFDGAKEKLVRNLGYPKEALEFVYDHEHWTRGLIIDTLRGKEGRKL